MATELRDSSGALIGYRLEHTAQQVDDGLNAISGKQNTLTFDSSPTENSTNPVTSGGVWTALSNKQNALSFDSTPTANSTNPVTSGGVWALFHSITDGNEVSY